MQGLAGITPAELRAAGQQPLMKVEIYVGGGWENLNSLDPDGENYVESASISLGGASMTPNPVEGTWGATLFNQDGIFHPRHPTSAYNAYLTTERLTRISIGATYGGVDTYWPRVIGHMDIPKFSSPDYRVSISGGDYMKRLRETEFRHLHNYWGGIWTTSSISSDGGAGIERYNEADAMDITGEVGNVGNWTPDGCSFDSLADVTGGSAFVGQMITTDEEPYVPTVVNDNIFVPVVGTEYAFNFRYISKAGPPAKLRVIIKQQPAGRDWIILGQKEKMLQEAWTDEMFYFTAQTVDPIEIWLEIYRAPIGSEFWVDQFSIFEFVPYWNRYYDLRAHDANETGVHHVTLNPVSNGAFIANVNEWIAVDANLTNVGGGQVGNCMQVASSGAAIGKAYQDVTTVVGKTYELSLYFEQGTSATGKFMIGITTDEDSIYDSGALSDATWTAYSYAFVATAVITRITLQTTDPIATNSSLFDEIILDPIDAWQGEVDEGWYYAEHAEPGPDPPAHPAGIVFFDPNKPITIGINNLIIYYYTATRPENAVARILYMAGVFDPITNAPYVSEAVAKIRMEAAPGYAATGITIDKIWFEPGTTCLEAIKMLCERGTDAGVPYVFYFTYDGQPVFKPRPTVGGAVFGFTDPKHIASIKTYQSTSEIKNRIVIKGYRQAEPVSRDETRPSQFTDERADDIGGGSIELYGERTLTINNYLFQDLCSITAMCVSLLARDKDPKWYSDLKIFFNPVPLEIGDSISWIERLSPTVNIAAQTGLIRDIKIDNYNVTYKCEL